MADTSGSRTDFVYALAAIPGGAWFAARESGLYRSIDDGASWHSLYRSFRLRAPLSTTALALSPDFERDMTLFAGVSGGILRSTDAGKDWDVSALPDPPPEISSLALSPTFSADGFALATSFASGVFYSTDGGASWLTGNFALLDFHVTTSAISPRFAEDRSVLIGTETGLFISINGGRSWDVADLPYVASPAVAFSPDGVIYVGTDGDGLYRSRDQGATWSRCGLKNTLVVSHILAPTTGDLFVIAEKTLYRSSDAGTTWQALALRAPAAAAVILDAGRLLIGYADGDISPFDEQP